MPSVSNIVKRPGSVNWYYRRAYPEDVQRTLGKREFWKSLGTSNLQAARAAATRVEFEFTKVVNEARRKVSPSEEDMDRQVADFYERELELDAAPRLAGGEDGAFHVRYRSWTAPTHAEELRKTLAVGETSIIDWAADEIIQREGWQVSETDAVYARLCHKLARAMIEALERASERDRGDFTGQPRDPVVTRALELSRGKEQHDRIMNVFERFATDQRSQNADTLDQTRKIVRRLDEFLGGGRPVTELTPQTCREWKYALRNWPVKANEVREFRGLDFKQVIEANVFLKRPAIGERTVAKYLSSVGRFGAWLVNHAYIDRHPVQGLLPEKVRGGQRAPFSVKQLETLFASPLFHACRGDGHEHEPGNAEIRDDRYWLFPLALFTGARLGELCQLTFRDLKRLDDIWYIDITDQGDGQRLKSGGSVRSVPLHPALVDLGFVDHVHGLDGRGAAPIFKRWSRNSRGQFGEASKWLNRYLERCGAKTAPDLTFHSFRHSFIDGLREAGFTEPEIKPVVGHSMSGVTRGYGRAQDIPVRRRFEMIRQLPSEAWAAGLLGR